MSKPNDPTWHQQREQELARHFTQLLGEKKFVIDTTDGRKSVTAFQKAVNEIDQSVAIKRLMIEVGSSDHALQRKLPSGLSMDVTFKDRHMLIFEKTYGMLRFQSVPPTQSLIRGEEIEPLNERDVRAALNSMPPPLSTGKTRVPLTVILFSSAGFTKEAQLLADRLAEKTIILVEPNDAGGWTVHGTPETRGVLDLLDPEIDDQKRRRIRDAIAESEFDLSRSGISAEKMATQTQLPLTKVEEEFKRFANERRGLTAKRMDGRLVLYRESTPPPNSGAKMPIIDKFKSIFSSSDEKKIAFLAERRTQIAQQTERVQEDMHALEQHEGQLKDQFKSNESALIRKRVTTQLVELRREIDRKAQLLQMLNQQKNVVAAHLHSLELISQGQGVKLPTGEELAEDAAKAEEVLAQVQADSELADELVGTGSIRAGMTSDEANMYDELMKELGEPKVAEKQGEPIKDQGDPIPQKSEPTAQKTSPQPQRRSEASPG
jgi:hypothetical protein